MKSITQTPLFSCEAVQKAAPIVNDYFRNLYFPIHDIYEQEFFTYLPTLLAVECLVYQADLTAENAKKVNLLQGKGSYFKELTKLKFSFINILKGLNSYDSIIEKEVARGEEFIKLENKINRNSEGIIEHSDIRRIAELRPSDVRLLHCILFRMLDKPYDEKLLSLLWPVEIIADLQNDLNHYTADVDQKQYNTYRMFVKLYKERASDYIKAELNHYENLFKERVLTFPIDERQRLMTVYSKFLQSRYFDIPEPILES